jgi:hypothetical protein
MTITADEERAARSVFAAWASLHTGAPRDPAALIDQVDVSHEHIGILSTDIHGRRVVWKAVPASGRVTFPTVAIETVDPWSEDATSLRLRSDHIAMCDECGGEKKIRCAFCDGTGKVLCATCDGQRKMYGYAANGSRRLLNCTTCRGKGELDCPQCRRGIATCGTCAGEGRLQRWIELEWWRRSATKVHPEALARRFGWSEDVSNDAIARDAELVCNIDEPHRLTPADLGSIPSRWVDVLHPPLQPGERVTRQRLRIARAPFTTVRYHLGDDEDNAVFTGRRLFAPSTGTASAFARRASNLHSLAWLLFIVGIVVTLLSLGRGLFYASVDTFLSLAAVTGMLFTAYRAAVTWTAERRRTSPWLMASAVCLLCAIGFAVAARPRLAHAERLIAANQLDAAELELQALGDDAAATAWADLRLARIRRATDPAAAHKLLAAIPRNLPQYAEAAPLVYLPLARSAIERSDWEAAAKTIVEARAAGIDPAALDALAVLIHNAGTAAVEAAKRESDPDRRLQMRIVAEATLVAWERASGHWGTHPLITLRTAMARDVATLEKAARRRRR